MAVKGTPTVIAQTATQLNVSENDSDPGYTIIFFPTPVDLYLGGPNVSNTGANRGAKLPAGSTLTLTLPTGDFVYGCVDNANNNTSFDLLHLGV